MGLGHKDLLEMQGNEEILGLDRVLHENVLKLTI